MLTRHAALLLVLVLPGCDRSAPPQHSAPGQPAAPAAAPVTVPAVGTDLVAAPETSKPTRTVLPISNGGFERVRDGAPIGWRAKHPESVWVAVDDVAGGSASLRVGPRESANEVVQKLELGAGLAGRTLSLSARVRADRLATARIRLSLKVGDEWQRGQSPFHPGDGKWQELEASLAVPDDYAGGDVWIGLLVRPSGDGAVFDTVRLSHR
jgi:hypothetical protein